METPNPIRKSLMSLTHFAFPGVQLRPLDFQLMLGIEELKDGNMTLTPGQKTAQMWASRDMDEFLYQPCQCDHINNG